MHHPEQRPDEIYLGYCGSDQALALWGWNSKRKGTPIHDGSFPVFIQRSEVEQAANNTCLTWGRPNFARILQAMLLTGKA